MTTRQLEIIHALFHHMTQLRRERGEKWFNSVMRPTGVEQIGHLSVEQMQAIVRCRPALPRSWSDYK